MLQMIKLLESYDLKSMGHNSPDYIHTMAEAFKLSFADREAYYGDPAHVEVPLETLLSEEYAALRRQMIDREHAWPDLPPAGHFPGITPSPSVRSIGEGTPPAPTDTSYVGVIDKDGNAFSSNPSDVTLNRRSSRAQGLRPPPVAPKLGRTRPRLGARTVSASPHTEPGACDPARQDGHAVRYARRRNQTQANVQVLFNMELFGMNPQEAIEAPRFMTHSQPDPFSPHTAYPGKLGGRRIDNATTDQLASRGHQVDRIADQTWKTAGVCVVRKILRPALSKVAPIRAAVPCDGLVVTRRRALAHHAGNPLRAIRAHPHLPG